MKLYTESGEHFVNGRKPEGTSQVAVGRITKSSKLIEFTWYNEKDSIKQGHLFRLTEQELRDLVDAIDAGLL